MRHSLKMIKITCRKGKAFPHIGRQSRDCQAMKYCPKCRSFYEDANLAFCLADGIPLVEMKQSDALWNEGAEAVSHSRQVFRQQMRKEKLIRISKLLVTVLIMILVISVVAMKIYINLPTKPDEKAQNISPSPTISPKIEPTIQITDEQTPLPTVSPNETASPTLTPTPTPSVTPTKTVTVTPTPTPTVTPPRTPTPIPPDPCIPQFANERWFLVNKNESFFRSSIEREKAEIIKEYQIKYRKTATAELTLTDTYASYISCFKAGVTVSYFWTIILQSAVGAVKEPNIILPTKQKSFSCEKGRGWTCSEKK